MAGRKTILTEEVQERLVEALANGSYIEPACQYAGISVATYYAWLERGRAEMKRLAEAGARPRKKETPFVEFLDAVEEAQAEAYQLALGTWVGAIRKGDWRAAESFMKRRFRDAWGDQEQAATASVQIVQNLQTEDVRQMTDRELLDILERAADQGGTGSEGAGEATSRRVH